MPITGKKAVKDEAGLETTEHYTFFVWKPRWFVLAQTEGQEYKPDAASNAWNRAKALEALNIEERLFEMVGGNCQGYSQHRTIAISPLAVNPLKTTIHEWRISFAGTPQRAALPIQSKRRVTCAKRKRSPWLSLSVRLSVWTT